MDGLLFATVRLCSCSLRAASRRSLDVETPTATCDVRPNPRRLASFCRYYYEGGGGGGIPPHTRFDARVRTRAYSASSSDPPPSPFCRSVPLTSFESDRVQGETFISTVLNNFSVVINAIFLLRDGNYVAKLRGCARRS